MFLQLAVHSREARIDQRRLHAESGTLQNPFEVAKSFLMNMAVIEKHLVSIQEARRFPKWVRDLEGIMRLKDPSQQREEVVRMDASHPLYPWLIEITRSPIQQD
jgi:hypothetical protein